MHELSPLEIRRQGFSAPDFPFMRSDGNALFRLYRRFGIGLGFVKEQRLLGIVVFFLSLLARSVTVGGNFPVLVGENFPVSCP